MTLSACARLHYSAYMRHSSYSWQPLIASSQEQLLVPSILKFMHDFIIENLESVK